MTLGRPLALRSMVDFSLANARSSRLAMPLKPVEALDAATARWR